MPCDLTTVRVLQWNFKLLRWPAESDGDSERRTMLHRDVNVKGFRLRDRDSCRKSFPAKKGILKFEKFQKSKIFASQTHYSFWSLNLSKLKSLSSSLSLWNRDGYHLRCRIICLLQTCGSIRIDPKVWLLFGDSVDFDAIFLLAFFDGPDAFPKLPMAF